MGITEKYMEFEKLNTNEKIELLRKLIHPFCDKGKIFQDVFDYIDSSENPDEYYLLYIYENIIYVIEEFDKNKKQKALDNLININSYIQKIKTSEEEVNKEDLDKMFDNI